MRVVLHIWKPLRDVCRDVDQQLESVMNESRITQWAWLIIPRTGQQLEAARVDPRAADSSWRGRCLAVGRVQSDGCDIHLGVERRR